MTSPFSKKLWRLLPGLTAALITVGLQQTGAIAPLEDAAYRGFFRIRGERQWDNRIVLITIDDATLAQLGEFPLSRDHYTRLLEQLSASPPAVIGFNLLFVEPSPADAEFAVAIADANNVVLAAAVDARGYPLLPVQPLNYASIASGHILKDAGSSGVVHQLAPQKGRQLAFGISLAQTYELRQSQVKMPPLEHPLRLNWPGPKESLSQYSLVDVLAGRIAPIAFDDKIVLVGMSATGVDALPTPFDYDPPASGLLMHAAVLDNILQQRSLQTVPFNGIWVFMLLSMPGVSYWLFGQPLRWQLAVTFAGCLGWLALNLLLFYGLYWLPVVPPLLLMGLTGLGTIFSQQLRANLALQHLLEDLWQHYHRDADLTLPPEVPPHAIAEALGPEVSKLAALANTWGWAQITQSAITQTVPVGLLVADEQGLVWFCNALAMQWLPIRLQESLTNALVPQWIDADTWRMILQQFEQRAPLPTCESQQGDRWFELRFERLATLKHDNPLLQDGRQGLLLLVENITHRKVIELQLRSLNRGLEDEIRQRASELETMNLNLVQEILEHQEAQAQLAHQARHDELTGLPNRTQFKARLTELVNQCHPGEQLFAVLFIDCDRFKLVNDSFGHLVGDQLLQAIAGRLEQSLEATDLVARFGGDEFTLLITHLQDPHAAVKVAQRIRRQLQKPFLIAERQLYTGCSIGIVLSDSTYQQADEMLRDADTAMYRAKHSGTGIVLFEPEMHLAVRSTLQLETDLRHSLQHDELIVHYQPIFGIHSQKIAGFEALLRWRHPRYGVVGPDKFIPIAEETGMIIPIGQWVMQEACQQLRHWQDRHLLPGDAFMSVNLSAQQFNEHQLLERIDATLRATALEGQFLKLEITESVLMTHTETATNTFKALKDRGICLGIDDFGTGYSSLSYLHHFPIDVLKVDRSFIQRMTNGQKHLSLVQAIKTLAYHFDMTMVAEGIETETQMEHLRAMECSLGQGYFFCPPMDHQTLEAQYLCTVA